jgi:hypothetical protein
MIEVTPGVLWYVLGFLIGCFLVWKSIVVK